jgi:hypothetical protein
VKLSLIVKEYQVRVSFTNMNRWKDPLTKINSVNRITWLQFMHYCCLKWFQFQEFCGSSCWQFWNCSFLCKASEVYPRRVFKHNTDFFSVNTQHFNFILMSSNDPVCVNLFTILWTVASRIFSLLAEPHSYRYQHKHLFQYIAHVTSSQEMT